MSGKLDGVKFFRVGPVMNVDKGEIAIVELLETKADGPPVAVLGQVDVLEQIAYLLSSLLLVLRDDPLAELTEPLE